MNAVLRECESCQSVQDGLAWTEAGNVEMGREAVGGGQGNDKAPPGAMALNPDWRELIESVCFQDQISVTWRPVEFEGQLEEGHSYCWVVEEVW